MEENQQQDIYNRYYRGIDLMEPQRKILFQKLKETIQQEQGELAYLLSCLKKNHKIRQQYTKELEQLQLHTDDINKIQEIQKKSLTIDATQHAILLAIHPLFDQMFDFVGKQVQPGIGYNEALRENIRFDLIFGERKLSNTIYYSRENYWRESFIGSRQERYEQKLQKRIAQRKSEKEKVRLPKDHMLITNENYEKISKKIIKHMEVSLQQYGKKFTLDIKNKSVFKQLLEKYFLYIFIQSLIDTKLVFDIKSTKGGKCLDGTIEAILAYFEISFDQKLKIDTKSIKKRLWSNLHSDDILMDLSYKNALLEDVEYWEKYLNTTYFKDKGISVNDLRMEMMKEYNAQEGVREKTLEMLNPRYHIYSYQVDKHTKHLQIIQEYQKKSSDQDLRIADIIKDINENLVYAQEKKKEHIIFEEDVPKIKPRFDHTLTEIQNRNMKRYQIPIQYRRIFGIVMNKINNYFQYKIGLIKKAEISNDQGFQNLLNSDQSTESILYFLHNYITKKDIDSVFDAKRSKKRSDRRIDIVNSIQKIDKPSKKFDNKDGTQLSLDF